MTNSPVPTTPAALSAEDMAFISQYNNQLIAIQSDGNVRFVSAALETLLGYDKGELIGKPFSELFSNSDFSVIRTKIASLPPSPSMVSETVYLKRKNGTYVWVDSQIRLMPRLSESSEVRQLAVFFDVNRLKHLEDLIRGLSFDPKNLTEKSFFESLISHTAAAFEVDYAFVTVTKPPYKSVEMLAFWKGDHFADPYEYDLDDTPCDLVIRKGEITMVPFGVQSYYPKDQDLVALNAQSYLGVPIFDRENRVRGHLALLDRAPLKMTDFRQALTTIFARQVSLTLETLFPYTEADNKSDKPAVSEKTP